MLLGFLLGMLGASTSLYFFYFTVLGIPPDAPLADEATKTPALRSLPLGTLWTILAPLLSVTISFFVTCNSFAAKAKNLGLYVGRNI